MQYTYAENTVLGGHDYEEAVVWFAWPPAHKRNSRGTIRITASIVEVCDAARTCVYRTRIDLLRKVVQRGTNLRFVTAAGTFEVAFLGDDSDYPVASKFGPMNAIAAGSNDLARFQARFAGLGLLEQDTRYIWWTLLIVAVLPATLIVIIILFSRGVL